MYHKINEFFGCHGWLGYFFVILFAFAVFIFIQANKVFADPDPFYHAKIAVLMLKQGVVKNFPWLAFTALPQIYADHHFLYHILLLPFVKFFNPLVGLKIATAIINTVFIALFYYFLKSNKAKWPALFTFLLLGSAPFMFRLNLAKANGLSLIFVMLVLFLMFRAPHPTSPLKRGGGKWRWLFVASFFYVWAYGGWPIGIFLGGVYFIASIISNVIASPVIGVRQFHNLKRLLRRAYLLAMTIKQAEWRPLIATIIGSLAGLVINPYFPQNLKFYWMQTVQIGLVNYGSKIGVGAEWYGFNLADLISYSWPIVLFLVLGLLFFAGRLMMKSPPPHLPPPLTPPLKGGEPLNKGEEGWMLSREAIINSFFFVIVSGVFFVLTLKSCRNTEYAFPLMLLSASFMLKYFYSTGLHLYFKNNFLKILKSEKWYKALIIYIAIMLALSFIGGIWRVKSDLSEGFGFEKYKGAMEAAVKNSNPGDVIFHSDWDDWPVIFYHNNYNRYIVGLDATFMYKYNEDLYQKWRDITLGKYNGDVYPVIKNDFNSTIIFIAGGDVEKMDKYFKNDAMYELLYDKDGKVYKIK
ncbi:MAG: hypothetical protein V1661_01665 [bacterium]